MSAMLSSLAKPADAYQKLYDGKIVVLKVSGREMEDKESFLAIVNAVRSFMQNGIKVLFTYGGGRQLDNKWNELHPGVPRPKVDGIGVVTEQMMEEVVAPVASDLQFQMMKAFAFTGPLREGMPGAVHIAPDEMQAHKVMADDGETYHADLVRIARDFRTAFTPGIGVVTVGFTGVDKDAEARGEYANVNLNADDVTRHIVEACQGAVNEVLMVTTTGGVQNDKGKVVSLLTMYGIDEILNDQNPRIRATDGMKKKLKEVRAMLEHVDKVAITSAGGLLKEIEYWAGSGTLCLNEKKATFSKATPDEVKVFKAAYADLSGKGIFRVRTPEELDVLAENHFVLRVQNSPLAGLSLIDASSGWSELAVIWSGYLENGIGVQLMEEFKKLVTESGKKVFALTTSDKAERLFAKAGFTACGKLQDVQANPPFELPAELAKYDTSSRSPSLFVFNAA